MAIFHWKQGCYVIKKIYLTGTTDAYEKNCDYWDPSTRDNTNYLDCKHSGCCGSFKGRHCCRGFVIISPNLLLVIFGGQENIGSFMYIVYQDQT